MRGSAQVSAPFPANLRERAPGPGGLIPERAPSSSTSTCRSSCRAASLAEPSPCGDVGDDRVCMARDAAGGVGGAEENHGPMMFAGRPMLVVAAYMVFVWLLRRETPLA